MKDALKFIPLEEVSATIQPEGYMMRKPCGVWWRDRLAELCWRTLRRLGALVPYLHTTITYRYGERQSEDVAELLHQQVTYIYRRGWNPEDYCVILGGKEFSEIIKGMANLGQFYTIPCGAVYYAIPGGYRGEVRGFPVHVVSHLEGSALVPRVMVEKLWDPNSGK